MVELESPTKVKGMRSARTGAVEVFPTCYSTTGRCDTDAFVNRSKITAWIEMRNASDR